MTEDEKQLMKERLIAEFRKIRDDPNATPRARKHADTLLKKVGGDSLAEKRKENGA